MKKILATVIVITSLTSSHQAAVASENQFGIGFGGLYGDFGVKLEHAFTDSLSVGIVQSWQINAAFTHYTAKWVFSPNSSGSAPFLTYGYGGLANTSYSDLRGTVVGFGYRTINEDRKKYTEFMVNSVVSVEAPYYLTSVPVFIGFAVGQNF